MTELVQDERGEEQHGGDHRDHEIDAVRVPRILLGKDGRGERPHDQREDDRPAPVDPNADPGDPAQFEIAVHVALDRRAPASNPHLPVPERPQHDHCTEHDVPDREHGVLRDRERRDVLGRGVRAQRGDVEGLRLTDPAGRDREQPGEHVEDATRKTVNSVMGIPKAAMKTTLTPIRQTYEPPDGSATSFA